MLASFSAIPGNDKIHVGVSNALVVARAFANIASAVQSAKMTTPIAHTANPASIRMLPLLARSPADSAQAVRQAP